jgi:hypothetical protein
MTKAGRCIIEYNNAEGRKYINRAVWSSVGSYPVTNLESTKETIATSDLGGMRMRNGEEKKIQNDHD